MSVREIVTLQLGHYANHVGAHLWNIQESSFVYDPKKATGKKEICHDVLYREGENRKREVTFTPRLIAFDLKGSLRSLKQEGLLYDTVTDEEEIQWTGDVAMYKEDGHGNQSFLQSLYTDNITQADEEGTSSKDDTDDEDDEGKKQLKKKKVEQRSKMETSEPQRCKLYNYDDHVTVWSDYLGTNFHPKSVHVVEEFRHHDELRPFDLYNAGDEVLSNYESTCEWEDRIHYFTEECDQLQGFHVLMDTHDGFGGLTAGVLKHIEDEFPGKGVLTFGFTPADLPDDTAQARATRIINSALSYDSACTHGSLFVPVSLAKGLWRVFEAPVTFPNLTYNNKSYHTSAILAAAMETMSLPYRLDNGGMNLRDITHSFNAQGRKLATLNSSLPLGIYQGESLTDFMALFCQKHNLYPWQPLTPHTSIESVAYLQSVVMRGVKDSQVKSDTDPRKLPSHLIGLNSTKDVLQSFLSEKSNGNPFAVNCLETQMKTTIPYPHIFNDNVNKTGYLTSASRPADVGVESVPVITSLQSSPETCGMMERLHDAAGKMNIKKHHRYVSAGLEEDDYVEVLDNLKSLANCYTLHTEAL